MPAARDRFCMDLLTNLLSAGADADARPANPQEAQTEPADTPTTVPTDQRAANGSDPVQRGKSPGIPASGDRPTRGAKSGPE